MPITSGVRLGPYEIVTLIGSGGMGEVYSARDTKLSRDVALKVLPEVFAADADRLARFEREAQLLASLNHPHIAAIYGLEDTGPVRALVLELVDGDTLADRLTTGPMPVSEALAVARQIAEALEAAHDVGIVHRDLKPANIKLRRDGVIKVLDFGLAKMWDPNLGPARAKQEEPRSQLQTITSPAMRTDIGVILGTAAYMAPEQAKSQQVDKRSDIWAFGCVLYEMLTGRRLFKSDDVTETLAFVLTQEPDWSALPPELPPAVRALLRRCLERDRLKRIGDVAAIRFVLEEGASLTSANSTDAVARSQTKNVLPRATGKLVGTIGDLAGNPRTNVRVSPNGKWAAFTRQSGTGQDIWVADLVGGGASRFTFDGGGRSPVWAPDSAQIAFLRQDTVYRKPVMSGGAEVALWSGPGTLALNDWSGDGRHLLLTRWDTSLPGLTGRGLWLLPDPLDDATRHEPTLFQADALHGQFGPKNGPARWVAFDAFDGSTRQVFVRTMPGGAQGKWQVSTGAGNTSRWRADGRELFILGGGGMLAADIDSGASFHSGAPRVLFAAPPAFGTAAGQYAHGWDVTPDGQRFLTTFPARDTPAPAITVVMNWQTALVK